MWLTKDERITMRADDIRRQERSVDPSLPMYSIPTSRLIREEKPLVQCCMCLKWGELKDTVPYEDEVEGIKLLVETIRVCNPCNDLLTVFAPSIGFLPKEEHDI